MDEPKSYELNHFTDLLQLEDDQIERLCAELPAMIIKVKALTEIMETAVELIGAGQKDEFTSQGLNPLIWIDDGKQDFTATVKVGEGEDESVSFKFEQK